MLFELHDVWKEQPAPGGKVREILRGVTAAIPGDGITCIVGASGTGKSTLLRLLNRLADPTRGQISFRGRPLTEYDPLELRRQAGMVVQLPVMLPGTVHDNLAAGLLIRGARLDEPEAWLRRVGLDPSLLERKAGDLSGGERQRVALARTLVTRPQALLLDEVTASLDAEAAAGVERLILELGLPAVWISHDPAQVRRVARHVLRLENGLLRQEVAV